MGKESGFDPFAPVKEITKAVKKEVSEEIAAAIFKSTAKLLSKSGKETAANLAGTMEKLAKRASRE